MGTIRHYEILPGLSGYKLCLTNDTKSNNTPYIVEVIQGSISCYNDQEISFKIYTNGELKPFEFNGITFEYTINGSFHYPGKYSKLYCSIKYLHEEIENELKISKTDYNCQLSLIEGIEYFFNEIILFSQCGSIDTYNIVNNALEQISWKYDNRITLNEFSQQIIELITIEKLIKENNNLSQDIIKKLTYRLKENILIIKSKVSLLETDL